MDTKISNGRKKIVWMRVEIETSMSNKESLDTLRNSLFHGEDGFYESSSSGRLRVKRVTIPQRK